MCGVIGIIGEKDIANELYIGLISLQHRGQDSAGILTHQKGRFHLKKEGGLVLNVFNEENLSKLKGNMGIGHVRYTTTGSVKSEDIHPFVINYPHGIGMVSNGNTTNYGELKQILRKYHRQLYSDNDLEVILNIFAHNLIDSINTRATTKGVFEAFDIFKAIKEVMKKVNGSYSILTLIANKGLVAFRDPHGIKPLIFGKKVKDNKVSYAFASETVALDVLGYKVIRDVKPGEAIFIDINKNVTSRTILKAKRAHCMFEWVYFARSDSIIEKKSVYKSRLNLGRELSKNWKKNNVDIVIPVPDTSRTAALSFAEGIGKNYREGLLKNRYIGRTFIMPTQNMREVAVKMKLNPMILELKDKKVAVVDDSIVRGTTSKKIINLIRTTKPKEVHIISTCPPIKYPCVYGVDMPTREELIASTKDIEKIKKELDADSVTYQTVEGLKRAIGIDGLCTACLDGEYPTDLSEETLKSISEKRRNERDVE